MRIEIVPPKHTPSSARAINNRLGVARGKLTLSPAAADSDRPAFRPPALPSPFGERREIKAPRSGAPPSDHAGLLNDEERRWPTEQDLRDFELRLVRPKEIGGKLRSRETVVASVTTFADVPSIIFEVGQAKRMEAQRSKGAKNQFEIITHRAISLNGFHAPFASVVAVLKLHAPVTLYELSLWIPKKIVKVADVTPVPPGQF
ncbi:hypothetical protein U8335_11380 [Roseiconus lacunae]|uniref:hypothetical protein n=1 Tax=Roseiconus lacunae TaxID=2605694 RepID=UPI003091A3EF|nr:hypothetical protein U8335_11380 [Stieleria sp. HD01]